MDLRDEFHKVTNNKYEELTSDSDRSLLSKAHRYVDFLESKIKRTNKVDDLSKKLATHLYNKGSAGLQLDIHIFETPDTFKLTLERIKI